MDKYGIPYYFTFGNHDTEIVSAYNISDVVEHSQYGKLFLGPEEINGRSNYVIDIKNNDNQIVHSIFMMDSGSTFQNNKDEIRTDLKCDNPRCISQFEQEHEHKFVCVDKQKGIYKCIYCEKTVNIIK